MLFTSGFLPKNQHAAFAICQREPVEMCVSGPLSASVFPRPLAPVMNQGSRWRLCNMRSRRAPEAKAQAGHMWPARRYEAYSGDDEQRAAAAVNGSVR